MELNNMHLLCFGLQHKYFRHAQQDAEDKRLVHVPIASALFLYNMLYRLFTEKLQP